MERGDRQCLGLRRVMRFLSRKILEKGIIAETVLLQILKNLSFLQNKHLKRHILKILKKANIISIKTSKLSSQALYKSMNFLLLFLSCRFKYDSITKEIHQQLPNLLVKNIPALEEDNNMSRYDLHTMFSRFKSLLHYKYIYKNQQKKSAQ